MKLWLLKRDLKCPANYCEFVGFVVSAEDEDAARDLVIDKFLATSRERRVWNDPISTPCKQIGISIIPAGIILDSNVGA